VLGGVGPAVIAGWICLHAQATPVLDLSTEFGGGHAPVVAGQTPEPGMAAVVQPAIGVVLGESDINRLTVRYAPRISWRRPNLADSTRPLLLHSAALDAKVAPARLWKFAFGSAFSEGEPDYATLTALLGHAQGALPELRRILALEVTTEASYALDLLSLIGLRAEFSHRRTLNEPVPAPGEVGPNNPFLARQQSISVGPYLTRRLSRRNLLQALADLSYEQRAPDLEFVVAYSGLGWQGQLTRAQTLSLQLGLAFTDVRGDSLTATGGQTSRTTPNGLVEYGGWISRGDWYQLRLGAALGVQSVIDPVLNRVGPRAGAAWSATMLFRPRWEAAFESNLSADLTTVDLPGPPRDETMASAGLRLRRILSPFVAVDARFRWSDRGPNLRTDAFAFHQRELWLSLSATVTTAGAGGKSAL
jgi:hypothetical protein